MSSVKDRIAALNKSSASNNSVSPSPGSEKPTGINAKIALFNRSKSLEPSSFTPKIKENTKKINLPVNAAPTTEDKKNDQTNGKGIEKLPIKSNEKDQVEKESVKPLSIKERQAALFRHSVSLPMSSSTEGSTPEKQIPEKRMSSISERITLLQKQSGSEEKKQENDDSKINLEPFDRKESIEISPKITEQNSKSKIETVKVTITNTEENEIKISEIKSDNNNEGTENNIKNEKNNTINKEQEEASTTQTDTSSLPIPPLKSVKETDVEGSNNKNTLEETNTEDMKAVKSETTNETVVEIDIKSTGDSEEHSTHELKSDKGIGENHKEVMEQSDKKDKDEPSPQDQKVTNTQKNSKEGIEQNKCENSSVEESSSHQKNIAARFGGIALPIQGVKLPSQQPSVPLVSVSITSSTTNTESKGTGNEIPKETDENQVSSTSPVGNLNIGEKPKPSKLPSKLNGASLNIPVQLPGMTHPRFSESGSLNIPIQLPGMTHPRFMEKQKSLEETELEKENDCDPIKENENVEPPKLEHATQSRATMTKKRRPKTKK